MTQLFKDMRMYGHITVLLLSAIVLGVVAHLGSIFLPVIQRDFGIFSIIVPSLTILIFLLTVGWSQPRVDAFFLFVLGVLWLTMGAWSADILGSTQCDSLGGQRTRTKDGNISARTVCYEMRVIEAFSWMLFALFAISLYILISLTSRSIALGRPYAWSEPIFELPWFGQYPGWPEGGSYPGGHYPQQQYAYPAGAPYTPGMMPMTQPAQMMGGGYVVQQNPGHSVVIQPGANGQAPTITQIPGIVSSV